MSSNLINAGSVEDIRSSLNLSGSNLSIVYLRGQILMERQGQNRSTVIKLLESQINKNSKTHANEKE